MGILSSLEEERGTSWLSLVHSRQIFFWNLEFDGFRRTNFQVKQIVQRKENPGPRCKFGVYRDTVFKAERRTIRHLPREVAEPLRWVNPWQPKWREPLLQCSGILVATTERSPQAQSVWSQPGGHWGLGATEPSFTVVMFSNASSARRRGMAC